MRKFLLSCTAVLMALTASAGENKPFQEQLTAHFKPYGFIRNYMAYDSRESLAGTGDLFYYLPKDMSLNELGEDMNRQSSFRFLSLTSRLGLDVEGYQVGKTSFGAKVEADFYAGLSSSNKVSGTATLRLRQAYLTIGWKELQIAGGQQAAVNLLVGQAWHPMAIGMPEIFSLSSGAPFGPFSRTPQVNMDAAFGNHWMLTASAIWQMQYTSAGPAGASAQYIKYSCTPEMYLGLTYRTEGFMARAGLDLLSIKPRNTASKMVEVEKDGEVKKVSTPVKVNDRITTLSPFVYLEYKKGLFSAKAKTIYSSAGEHFNLMSGYGVSQVNEDASWDYTPLHSSSSWISLAYGKKVKGVLFAGYVKNLGTSGLLADVQTVNAGGTDWTLNGKEVSPEVLKDYAHVYFSKNGYAHLNSMFRVTPTIYYNIGKFSLGLEYEVTSVQYGKNDTISFEDVKGNKVTLNNCVSAKNGLSTSGLHWVTNHRVQMMVKFSF